MTVTARSISKSIFALSTLVVTALGIAGASYASPISILASKDAYIRSSANSNLNYGADANLQVKFAANNTNSVSNNRKSWIGFNLGATDPTTITSATLALTVGDSIGANDNNLAYTIHVYGLVDGTRDNWVEGTGTTAAPTTPPNSLAGITWNNAPANNTASSSLLDPTGSIDLGTFVLNGHGGPTGTVINFSSAALLNLINTDTNGTVSIALTRDTIETTGNTDTVVQTFASREHGGGLAGPTLLLNSTTVPEASALVLIAPALGLMGMVMAARKSRKA